MAAYSRVNFPDNFYDITSDMLLTQPEPQYLYADFLKSALALSLNVPGEIGLPGRAVGGAGAQYATAERDRLMLQGSAMPGELVAAKVDFKGLPGNNIRINRPVYTNTTYTEAARRIPTGTSISQVGIVPQSQQTNLTLFRYGGPYDQTNSRVAPYPIEAFDAEMGVHKASSIIGTHLKRDFDRFLDSVMVSLADLAANTDYPEGMSADNDATAVGSFPFTYEQLSRVERNLDDANMPTLADGYRVLVLHPTQCDQLRQDRQYQRAAQNFPQYSIVFPQYVASVNKFHIFKSTTLTTATNSSSVTIYRGHAIVPGTWLGGMGRMPRVAPNTNDNYGETALVVWLSDLAFGLANDTFVRLVSSSA
jgi:hypothetical protein